MFDVVTKVMVVLVVFFLWWRFIALATLRDWLINRTKRRQVASRPVGPEDTAWWDSKKRTL